MLTQKGFTLIELLIVILIVGILAAVATPLYLGYVKDAKTAEAKAIAGSLWTAVQAGAIAQCGTETPVSAGFAKAGFSSGGETTPVRWTAAGSNPLTVDCGTGAADDGWWLGFDCAHAGDAIDPALPMEPLYRYGLEDRALKSPRGVMQRFCDVIRTQDFVEAECRSLCAQAAAAR